MRTREIIIDTAISALAANSSVSMTQIAEQAGVGRATIHRLFSTREALIEAVAMRALQDVDQATAHLPLESLHGIALLEKMLDAVIPLGDRYYYLATLGSEGPPAVVAEYRRQAQQLGDVVERLKTDGAFDARVPTAWIIQAIDALIWAAWDGVGQGTIARAEATALVLRTLTQGLGGEPRKA